MVLLLFPLLLTAQTAASVYPADGVYTSFSSFRTGTPALSKKDMIRSVTSDAHFTIRQWINTENLLFVDKDSTRKNFNRNDFWGYVENGTLYIFLGLKFHKVTLLGQISYFLESYPVIKGNMAPVVTDTRSSSTYRLLDMETGDISDYTVPNLEELLSRDEVIYEKFRVITSAKTKKKKMYSFMEQFNAAHPLERITEGTL